MKEEDQNSSLEKEATRNTYISYRSSELGPVFSFDLGPNRLSHGYTMLLDK